MSMLFKSIDVLIYYEHVVRELDSCMILKYRLEQKGLTAVVVPIHRNRYLTIVKYKPRIIVMPFLFADENDIVFIEFSRCYGDVLCLNLHHEQLYNEMTKVHFMPKNQISRDAYHLSWGKNFANDLLEVGVMSEKIWIDGNPRTDNYFFHSSDWIKNKVKGYKDVIFIPTSFSWAFVDESYFLEKAKVDPIEFGKQKKKTVETVDIFLLSIRKLAYEFPDKIFILRPHPFEDIVCYENCLKSLIDRPLESNIKILREGNVYDWLKVSDLVIGWLTTVSLEASLYKKKNVIYLPIELDKSMQTHFVELYDRTISDYEELKHIVGHIDSYNPTNPKLNDYIVSAMGEADGFVNTRIAQDIYDILDKVQQKQKNTIRTFVILGKAISIDFVKNIFIRLKILSKVNSMYSGLNEDLLSYSALDKYYNQLKVRFQK